MSFYIDPHSWTHCYAYLPIRNDVLGGIDSNNWCIHITSLFFANCFPKWRSREHRVSGPHIHLSSYLNRNAWDGLFILDIEYISHGIYLSFLFEGGFDSQPLTMPNEIRDISSVDSTSFPYIFEQNVDVPLKSAGGLVRMNLYRPKIEDGARVTYGLYEKDIHYKECVISDHYFFLCK